MPPLDTAAGTRAASEHSAALFTAEGPVGVARNEIDARFVRRFALGLGMALAAETPAETPDETPDGAPPRVGLAGDGRALSAEFIAAAGEGLGFGGCRVVELGAATAGSLERAIFGLRLAGGLLVGNASGTAQTISLKCWGSAARPWSRGGRLDAVIAAWATAPDRTSRRSGGVERAACSAEQRACYADLFHGLRPLRFVLDSSSGPLVGELRQLVGTSACQIIAPRLPAAGTLRLTKQREIPQQPDIKAGRPAAGLLAAGRPAAGSIASAHRGRRVELLRQQVTDERADFGLWIDGDGDLLDLVDETGRKVSPERLMLALVRRLPPADRQGGVVLEAQALAAVYGQFSAAGIAVLESAATREAMYESIERAGAVAGAGPSGRLWFRGEFPLSDALQTTGRLLQLLSEADRPLSEVLA